MGLIDRKERAVELLISRLPEDLSRKLQAMFIEKRLSIHAKLTYAQALEAWWRFTKVDPSSANRKDIRRFLEAASRDYKETTVDLFLTRIKTFVRWSRGELTNAWESIKPSRNRDMRDLRDKILTLEEVKALIKSAGRPKSKAIVALLYEGALRIGELRSLRIKDLEFTEYGFKIRVSGKTGERVIPLIYSAPYLRVWLQMHPDPRNPNAPLFPSKGLEPISEGAIYSVVTRAAERAGIKKKIHPHMLRHTRLTELAKYLTEQELKVFSGWTKDSRMASIYVHLSGRDVEEAILRRVHGVDVRREELDQPLKPEVCPNCGYINPADAEFCMRCGYPLSEEAIRKVGRLEGSIDELLEVVLKDPEFKKTLLRKLREFMAD